MTKRQPAEAPASRVPNACPHCGAPGVPKVISFLSREIRTVVLPCACAKRAEERERRTELARRAREHLCENGLPPALGAAWKNLRPLPGQSDAYDLLGEFVVTITAARTNRGQPWGQATRTRGWTDARPSPPSPAIFGPFGSGKTHLVASAALALADEGVFVTYADVSTLIAEIRRGVWGDEGLATLEDDLASVPVLILDDLGIRPLSEWGGETIYGILNRRVGTGLPTIVTTDVPFDEMTVRLSEAFAKPILARLRQASVWARIGGEAAEEVERRTGSDRRTSEDRRADTDRRAGLDRRRALTPAAAAPASTADDEAAG